MGIIIVKFIYSEKATKFCEIFTLLLSSVVPVKSKVKISQNFVAFSEYMNFNSNAQHEILMILFFLTTLAWVEIRAGILKYTVRLIDMGLTLSNKSPLFAHQGMLIRSTPYSANIRWTKQKRLLMSEMIMMGVPRGYLFSKCVLFLNDQPVTTDKFELMRS